MLCIVVLSYLALCMYTYIFQFHVDQAMCIQLDAGGARTGQEGEVEKLPGRFVTSHYIMARSLAYNFQFTVFRGTTSPKLMLLFSSWALLLLNTLLSRA
jgi:hypothetical protein